MFEALKGQASTLSFLRDTVIAHEVKTGRRREGDDFTKHVAGDQLVQLGLVLGAAESAAKQESAARVQASAPLALLTRVTVDVRESADGPQAVVEGVDAVLVPVAPLIAAAREADKLPKWWQKAQVMRDRVPAVCTWGRCVGMLETSPELRPQFTKESDNAPGHGSPWEAMGGPASPGFLWPGHYRILQCTAAHALLPLCRVPSPNGTLWRTCTLWAA